MERLFLSISIVVFALNITAQVQIDKSIHLTGDGSDAKVSGIKEISNAEDAMSAEAEQKNTVTYAIATNVLNDFSISLTPAPEYTPGLIVHFLASSNVTGA